MNNSNYVFDIMYTEDMGRRFIDLYNPLYRLISGHELRYHLSPKDTKDSMVKDLIQNVVKYELWKIVNNEKYESLGNCVSVKYIPNSQKYISHYNELEFNGRIIFADRESDNMFFLCESPIQGQILIRSL